MKWIRAVFHRCLCHCLPVDSCKCLNGSGHPSVSAHSHEESSLFSRTEAMHSDMEFNSVKLKHGTWDYPQRYENLCLIGSGSYGSVCSAFDTVLNRQVAMKKLSRPFYSVEYSKRTYRELILLKHMNHENIICLTDVFTPQTSAETLQDVYLVTPLMQTDLNTIIKTQKLTDGHVQFIIYQILRALKYLHSANLIHRDLKPTNVAMNTDCEVKIIDFGLARQSDSMMSMYVATRWYRAPELILQWLHYKCSVDIWSVGCIMAELLSGQTLFPGRDQLSQLKLIIGLIGRPTGAFLNSLSNDALTFLNENIPTEPHETLRDKFSKFDSRTVDFLEKLLILDPDERLTAKEALRHLYLAEYHDSDDESDSPLFVDPYAEHDSATVDDWKQLVWANIQNFVPNISSLTFTDDDNE